MLTRRSVSGRGRASFWGRTLGPEAVAAVLVVVLYGTVTLANLPAAPRVGGSAERPPGSHGLTGTPAAASPTPNPHRSDILAVLEMDRRLLENRTELVRLLHPDAFRSSEVATVLRRINATVQDGLEPAGRLSLDSTTSVLGSQLEFLYANARSIATDALRAPLSSDGYRAAAEAIVDSFAELPPIDARLTLLLAADSPGGSPAASGGPIASPTATTRRTPGPSSSPGPTSTSPSASPTATSHAERLANPGFETGLAPWRLVLAGPEDRATTAPDAPLSGNGSTSLRVELVSTTARAGIAVRQDGVTLDAGARYSVRITVRASAARDIRLRVIGPNEETFTVRLATVGPTALVATLVFTALLDEPSAAFQIDLGGATGTVWLDDASFIRTTPDS